MGQSVELRIDRLAAGGDGVGRLHGLAVFVPLTAPGDRLRVRIEEVRRSYARAELLEVLEPGPARRAPPCPLHGRCGGCTWLHIEESAQSGARIEILREALRRLGGLGELPPIEHVASPRALRYRSRARVARAGGQVGFRARRSDQIVDVERCAVLDPATQRALESVRSAPGPAQALAQKDEFAIRGYGPEVEVGGRRYGVGPRAFFQANAALWERWLALVVEACGSGHTALELYAGVGFYTAALTERFERVVAVERGPAARDARRNAPGARVVRAAAEEWIDPGLARLAPELVLLNPPREGCHRKVMDAIASSSARRVVYVSCEPATLARDLARLGDAWRVARLVAIDALPQTHHVEALAVMERLTASTSCS